MKQEKNTNIKVTYSKPEVEIIEMEIETAILGESEVGSLIPGMGNGGNIGPEAW